MLAERSVQVFQSPRVTLQNYQPFRIREILHSGPVTSALPQLGPSPSLTLTRQNGGSRPYT